MEKRARLEGADGEKGSSGGTGAHLAPDVSVDTQSPALFGYLRLRTDLSEDELWAAARLGSVGDVLAAVTDLSLIHI